MDADEYITAITSLLSAVQGARSGREALIADLKRGATIDLVEQIKFIEHQGAILDAFASAFELGLTEVESFDIPDTSPAVFAKDLKLEDAFVMAGQMYEVFAMDRAFQSSKESITLVLKHLDLDSNRQLICHVPPDTKIELIARKKT